MADNIITAVFGATRETKVRPRYRYDQGQVLIVRGVKNLPDFYEVHFANEGSTADATPLIGTADGVTIPDTYFQSGATIYAYIYVHDEATDGTTVYKVTIPIINRARPANVEPSPEDADIIAQAIVALNENVGRAEDAAEQAEESAESAQSAADGAAQAERNAGVHADRAEAAAQAAEASAGEVEGYTERAETAAQNAQSAAENAEESAQAAEQSAYNAGVNASSAASAKNAAQNSAARAVSDASAAASAKADAVAAKTDAQTAATSAASSRDAAQIAKVAAETAQSAAEAAQTAANAAESNAQTYAGQAFQSATNAAQSAANAAQTLTQVQAEGATQIAAVDAEGQRVIDSIPEDYTEVVSDVADLKSQTDVDDSFAKAGKYSITANDMESGTWYYSEKRSNSKRLRNKMLYRVFDGMVVRYANPTMTLNISVLETKNSNTFIQTSGWIPSGGTGEITIVHNGYLVFVVESANDITVSDYDSTAIVIPTFLVDYAAENQSAILTNKTYPWEQGTYNTQGSPATSTTRIRTPGYITRAAGYCGVTASSGYEFALQAYDASMSYLGLLQTDGTFAASSVNMALLSQVSFGKTGWEKYSFRLIGKKTNNGTITPSDGVNFIFAGTEFNSESINVKDFGAKGNGVTDDTKALQAALIYGGRVYIPDGVYPVSTSLIIYSNTNLILSPKAKLLRVAEIRCLIHSYCESGTTGYNGQHDITIDGGMFDLGTGFTQGASNVAFIHATNITIKNCTMEHSSKGYHFCDIAGCKNVLIENCIFQNSLSNEYTACFIQVDCPWGLITYTYDDLPESSACFDSTPCVQYIVRGCTFYLNDYSPAFGNHNDGQNRYIVFEDNYVYGGKSTRGAIAFADYKTENHTDVILIRNNVFSGCDYGFKFMNNGTGKAYIRDNVFENIGTLQVNPSSPVGQFEDNITITTN